MLSFSLCTSQRALNWGTSSCVWRWQISSDSTEQQTLPPQTRRRPSSHCGVHVWSTPGADWLSTLSLAQRCGDPTRARHSSETEGRDRPLCPNVLIWLERAEEQQIAAGGGGGGGGGGIASVGWQRWNACVCVSEWQDSPAVPSVTSQGELIGCLGPGAPPSLSVPCVPTPAKVLTLFSNRSI